MHSIWGVKQEWLVVFSAEAYEREALGFQKHYLQQSEKELKVFEKLCKETFTCANDAQKSLDTFVKKAQYCQLHNPEIIAIKGHAGRGRPQKGAELQILCYHIQSNRSSQIAHYQALLNTKGLFIIASNYINNQFSPEQKLLGYKGQSKVERGFRFLKDKQFLASTMFVKKPERIETILMIMSLSLLIYAALERKLKLALKEQNLTVPNQLKKEVQNPTMKWVFALFKGMHCLYTHSNDNPILLNINPLHIKIIQLLGKYVANYYKLE